MWPVIRHVGLVDILVSLCHIGYISPGIFRNEYLSSSLEQIQEEAQTEEAVNFTVPSRNNERRYVFYLLSLFLLVLRLIAAVVLFGASFKEEFRKQFNACILWMFIALITVTILSIQLCICNLKTVEIWTSVLEIIFRIGCGTFIVKYMRNEK